MTSQCLIGSEQLTPVVYVARVSFCFLFYLPPDTLVVRQIPNNSISGCTLVSPL